MNFYNRKSNKFPKNGMLYVRINGKRISTKLEDTKANRKLFTSYSKNDEFFKKFNVVKDTVPTLVKLCVQVLDEKEKTIKATSYNSYLSLYNSRIFPFFKDMLVSDIKPIHIKEFYNTFEGSSSLNTCQAILKSAFDIAILSEYIEYTPLIIKKPVLKSDYKINPFTLEEMKLLIDTAKGQFKNIVAISFFTGLRTGELIGLKWSDIDFDSNKISVNRTITGGYIQTPKTESSKAVIDLPSEALPYFKNQRLKVGLSSYIFKSSINEHYKGSISLQHYWFNLLDETKLERRGIYQTRHTFASIRLNLGESLLWVSYMLRHKSPDMTQRKYFKYMPNINFKKIDIDLNLTHKEHTVS